MIIEIAFELFSIHGLTVLATGLCIGILGGALPGVSSAMTIALVAAATYTMDPLWGITFLAAAQVGSTYGGSISATVLNIPGTPASAATAIEGYKLTQKGEAAKALSVNAISSFVGNTVGVVLLVVTMPLMLKIAMSFGPWELFWFAMFGVVICAQLSRANFAKGLMAALFGLLLAMVGRDHIGGTPRFTYGLTYLIDGIPLIPAMVGLFGMSEVMSSLIDYRVEPVKVKRQKLFAFQEWAQHSWLSIKASAIGFVIGTVPGVGANIASWVGYGHALSKTKNPDQFGEGAIEGLIGSESANNACVPGAYGPLLVLGVPGDAVTAVVLGVLILHGVQPGPTFLRFNPQYLYQIAMAMFVAGVLFLLIGTLLGRAIVYVLKAPLPAIMASVALLCVIGSYGVNFRIQDVYLMFFMGILGLFMKRYGFPIAPLLLSLVIGGGLADANFRRAIILGRGSFIPFFTRPISMVMVGALVFMTFKAFVWPVILAHRKGRKGSIE